MSDGREEERYSYGGDEKPSQSPVFAPGPEHSSPAAPAEDASDSMPVMIDRLEAVHPDSSRPGMGLRRKSSKFGSMLELGNASGFTTKQLQILTNHFDQLDLNGDGHVSATELFLMFKALKVPMTHGKLDKMIAEADLDGNGTLEFSEFVLMVASLKTKDNEAWMHLVRSTQPSVLKRVQEQAKAAVGIVDPEVQKRQAAMMRGKSFFVRKDAPSEKQKKKLDPLTHRLARSATSLGFATKPSENDIEMQEYDVTSDPDIIRQLRQMQTKWSPWFLLVILTIQICLMIYAIVKGNGITSMSINFLAGPDTTTLVQIEVDCTNDLYKCAALTGTVYDGDYLPIADYYAGLAEFCGLGGFRSGVPDQWFRFIIPVFLNVGLIQLALNVFIIGWRGFAIEEDIGPFRMAIIYLLSSIFGVALGANNTPNIVAVASTSSTFSFLGILFLDLFMNWQLIHSPWKDLLLMMLVTIVALGLGVLPYIDLFQSLGTLTCAIVLGVIFVPHLSFGKWDAVRKKVAIAVAVPALFIMYFLVFWYFYKITNYNCKWCGEVSNTFNI